MFVFVNNKSKVLVERFIASNMSKLYVILLFLVVVSCSHVDETTQNFQRINGEAQGTTYSLVLDTTGNIQVSKSTLDSIFTRIDSSLSAWQPNSVISSFNSSDSMNISDAHFLNVFYRSLEINQLTNGAFNAQIEPLVKAWGFGNNGKKPEAKFNPDSLLEIVNRPILKSVDSTAEAIIFKKTNGQTIDVNGIAQGYTVDVVYDFFKHLGMENFLIEVGGEVRAAGANEEGQSWKVGIDKPISDLSQRELEDIAEISNRALATSGSYRKFYELDGKKYSHTIDPATGYPVDHNLLSASVIASNCTNADAFATAFMVMGKDRTLNFIKAHPDLELEVYLIYGKENGELGTTRTKGFPLISENHD